MGLSAQTSGKVGLFKRYEANPILTAKSWPYPANAVFNAGAMRLEDGKTLLLCRVEDLRGHSHFCSARSENGIDNWEIAPTATLLPNPDSNPEEVWGIEDPRIVFLQGLGKYAVTYTSWSRGGPGVSLALTSDFVNFERLGMVMPPHDKDAAFLPRRINGCWGMVHRPTTVGENSHIWISYSPDLKYWGDHRIILMARRGAWWDAGKIGLSCPMIETPEGWLMIYHGVRQTASGSLYRQGLALFDLQDPEHCLLRGDQWIFGPEEDYELVGDVGGVVFLTGYTIQDDGDTLHLYYGGADKCVALATASLSELVKWIKKHGQPDSAIDVWF
ncbi:MAG: glycosidase [Chloroflexota bacterium]|nr:glycosidase [Chloroflexota bacterium]